MRTAPPQVINSTSTPRQHTPRISPDITALNDGGFLATWQSIQNGSYYDIYAQRYAANGDTVDSEFLVNATTANQHNWPIATSLSDGGFLISWTSQNQDGDGYGIYAQRYDAAGAVVTAEFQVNTFTGSNQNYSDVTSLAGGGFVITWQSYDVSDSGVYARMYDGSGVPINDEEFLVNSYTSSGQIQPAIAGLHDGGFVVAWESWYQDGSGDGIYAQVYDSEGSKIGAEFRVNSTTANDQQLAAITALEDGGFVVSWEPYGQDGSADGIYAQRYLLNQPGDDAPVGISFSSTDISEDAAIGTVVATLTGIDPDPGDSFSYRLNTAGSPFEIVGNELRTIGTLDFETAASYDISIRIEDSTSPAPLSHTDTYTINVNDENEVEPLGSAIPMDAPPGQTFSLYSYDPRGTSLANGFYVVVYSTHDDVNGGSTIYGQLFDQDDQKAGGPFAIAIGSVGTVPEATFNMSANVTPINNGSSFVVTWIEDHYVTKPGSGETTPYGSEYQLLGARYDIDSDIVNTSSAVSFGILDSPDETILDSRVTGLTNGGFAVAYLLGNGPDTDVYMQLFDNSGTSTTDPMLVNGSGSNIDYLISVAPYSVSGFSDSFVVLYGTEEGIKGQFYDGSGNVIGQEFFSADTAIADDLGTDPWETLLSSRQLIDLSVSSSDSGDYLNYSLFQPDWLNYDSPQSMGELAYAPGGSIDTFSIFPLDNNEFIVIWAATSGIGEQQLYSRHFAADPAVGAADGPPADLILHGNSVIEEEYGAVVSVLSVLDPDDAGQDLTYSITAGNTGGLDGFFEISGNTLKLRDDIKFDYENQPLDGGLNLEITVTDGIYTLSRNFSVGIIDKPEYGDISWTPVNRSLAEVSPWAHASYTASQPQVTALAQGGYVIVDEFIGSYVYGTIYDESGNVVVSSYNISPSNPLDSLSTAGLENGNFVTVWAQVDTIDDGFGSSWEETKIYHAIDDKDGNDATQYSTNFDTDVDPTNPDPIVVSKPGGYIIAWVGDSDGDGTGIYAQSFDLTGTPWTHGVLSINEEIQGNQTQPVLASFADGSFLTVWADDNGLDGDGRGIFARYYDNSDSSFEPQFQVNLDLTSGDQINPAVAVNESGDIMISWKDSGWNDNIIARSFTYKGSGWVSLSPYDIWVTENYSSMENQGIVAVGDNFLLYWTATNESSYGIRGQLISPNGTSVNDKFSLDIITSSLSADPPLNVSVTTLDNNPGELVVTWEDESSQVYRQHVTLYKEVQLDERDNRYEVPDESYPVLLDGQLGDDRLEGGTGNDLLLGGEGDDILIGGMGDDIIKGGLGIDNMDGGDGDDTFIIWGSFAANDYVDYVNTYIDESVDAAGDSLLEGNPTGQEHYPTIVTNGTYSEIINGNAGNDTVETYGFVDTSIFNGSDFTGIINIVDVENLVMHSEVTLDAGQLEDFGFTTISGSGDEFHILNIVGEGLVDLTGIIIDNIDVININPGVELILTEEQEAALNINMAESSVEENPAEAETGEILSDAFEPAAISVETERTEDTSAAEAGSQSESAGEPLFGDDLVSSLETETAPVEPIDHPGAVILFGDVPEEDAGIGSDLAAADTEDSQAETAGQPIFGDDETGSGSADTYLPEPLLADTGEDVSMDVTIEQPLLTVDDLAVEPDTDPALLWLDSQVDDVDTAS